VKKIFLTVFLIFLFLFIRFYHINNSLYFFDDMGRDLLVLLEWQKEGKIPLLGPQTSALPINQSPIYFYFLMPFYLIFKGSPYTALIVNSLFYLAGFILSLRLTKESRLLTRASYLVFFLFIFHPQHILQNRFVWNPSLLPPILILALINLCLFLEKAQDKHLFFSSFWLALAVSLSYSVLPMFFAWLTIFIFSRRQYFFKLFFYFFLVFAAFNITVLAQLSKRIVSTGGLWQTSQVYQTSSSLSQKLADFINYVLGLPISSSTYCLLMVIFLIGFYFSFFSGSSLRRFSSQVFLLTSLMTLFSPFRLHAHYIFAITSSFFLLLVFLDWKLSLPLISFFLLFYWQPKQLDAYFKPAPRTYQQMDVCLKEFCSQFKRPLFVSVQSDMYPYHYGPEHRYLMIKNGCRVKHIEKEPQSAEFMAVILDNGSFSERTSYYELDLFGRFDQIQTFNCQPNYKIVLLKRRQN
jgi:hypothetical protein